MALVACPGCGKRVSDKADECQHCGQQVRGIDPEKQESMRRTNKIKKSQTLMMQSFLAIMFFIGGFAVLFWGDPLPNSWQHMAANGAIAIGFIWYIVARVQILLLKRS